MWSVWNQPSAASPGSRSPRVRDAGSRCRATSPSVIEGPDAPIAPPDLAVDDVEQSATSASVRAAKSSALARTFIAARRVASPVITVTREANAPMPVIDAVGLAVHDAHAR